MRADELFQILCFSVPVLLAAGASDVARADTADAAEPAPARVDHARFRGGIAVEGGYLGRPGGDLALGAAGLRGDFGGQWNDRVAFYGVQRFDYERGTGFAGFELAEAAMVDFTIVDRVSVGFGPETSFALGTGADNLAAYLRAGGVFRVAAHPHFVRSARSGRRSALSIALDTHVLDDLATSDGPGPRYVVQTMLSVGYEAM